MPIFTDQLDREIELPGSPKRIVSLVPSQTEVLHALGLDGEVIGITRFCVHPKAWHEKKTRIGGTKAIRVNRIKELQPDLIIANQEENRKRQVERLAEHFPVWISNVVTLADALHMIFSIGELVDREKEAEQLQKQINDALEELKSKFHSRLKGKKVLYFIWKQPYMVAGNNTFINSLLEYLGFENPGCDFGDRYPSVTTEQLKNSDADYFFLSSEPFPFKQKHADEMNRLFPNQKAVVVDGEYFSWYGPRMLGLPAHVAELEKRL